MRFAPAVICACVALAGCGSDERAQPAAPPAVREPAIAIERPADGMSLRAQRTPGGRLRLRMRVSGSAPAGSAVLLRASCAPRPCAARATSGPDGRWATAMTLATTGTGSFVTIDAAARADAPRPAVVTIELLPPRRTAPVRRTPRRPARARKPAATTPPPAPARPPLPRAVLVIGDSLALGMADALRAALPGWSVEVDGRIGRPLAEGMRILAQRDAPPVIALSLFTNDDPAAVQPLADAIRATAERPGGCAVWSTIVRPPYNGVSYAAANDVLMRFAGDPRLAPRLRLVDWRATVARHPSFVAGDGVHATPAGYRARGQLYADAIRACARR